MDITQMKQGKQKKTFETNLKGFLNFALMIMI